MVIDFRVKKEGVNKMPKFTILSDDGKTPVLEFDSEKENPDFYEMLELGYKMLNVLVEIDQNIPYTAPKFWKTPFEIITFLKKVSDTEVVLRENFSKNISPTAERLKEFITFPKLNVSIANFSATYFAQALSQTRLLLDDIENTYDRTLNRCIVLRADAYGKVAVWLAILSIILGGWGVILSFG